MRLLPVFLLAAACLACSHKGTRIQRDSTVDYTQYRRYGVAPVIGPRDKAELIARDLEAGLQRLGRGIADGAALRAVLKQSPPDADFGLGLEALENLKSRTSVEAVLFLRVAPDLSAASLTILDVSRGEPVLSAELRPAGKAAVFPGPEAVADEALRVIGTLTR